MDRAAGSCFVPGQGGMGVIKPLQWPHVTLLLPQWSNPCISDANASIKLRGVMQIRNAVFKTSRQFGGFFVSST